MEKEYKRRGYAPDLSDCGNILAVNDILLNTIKVGRPASYEDSERGLAEFKENTISYLEHVQEINESEISKKVMIDIEGWTCHCGITRATLSNYENTRGQNWREFIAVVKNGIAAAKKEGAFHGQIQPMVSVFDLANNHGYKNTSEFKIDTNENQSERKFLSVNELPHLGSRSDQEKLSNGEALPKLRNYGGQLNENR